MVKLGLRAQDDSYVLWILRVLWIPRELAERSHPWVFLAADNQIPRSCRDVIADTGSTVAIIHPNHPDSHTENQWHHGTKHRWAHAICRQDQGTVSPNSSGLEGHVLKTGRAGTSDLGV